MNTVIDSHCHLYFKEFDSDRSTVITNAKKAGIKKFIVPGIDVNSSKKAVTLSQKYPTTVYAAIGINPYEAQKINDISPLKQMLKTNNMHNPSTTDKYQKTIVAIGECGLDFHIYKNQTATSKKYKQQKLLEGQLMLAADNNLPAIIHCRDAFTDLFSVIDSLPTIPRGVIHCFSGGLEDVRFAQKRNLYIGFDGNITYSKHLSRIIPNIPLSMILLESDSPYLTPVPYRGRRNEPKYIFSTAKYLAKLYNISISEICTTTYQNTSGLFSIN